MFGVVDLLVRSDVARSLCPDSFVGDPLELAAIGLSHGRHYRVVDVKFRTLDLLKTGGLSTSPSDLDTLAQAWVYNEALGRMQGYTPPASYVAGRAWKQGDERGDACWERIARVPHDTVVRGPRSDCAMSSGGRPWIRRVRTRGREWRGFRSSVAELWPNMKRIGQPLAPRKRDRTTLRRSRCCRVEYRSSSAAPDCGVTRWDDPRSIVGTARDQQRARGDARRRGTRRHRTAARPCCPRRWSRRRRGRPQRTDEEVSSTSQFVQDLMMIRRVPAQGWASH